MYKYSTNIERKIHTSVFSHPLTHPISHTHHVVLHEEADGVSDSTRDEVGSVAQEDGAVAQNTVLRLRLVGAAGFFWNRLSALGNLTYIATAHYSEYKKYNPKLSCEVQSSVMTLIKNKVRRKKRDLSQT